MASTPGKVTALELLRMTSSPTKSIKRKLSLNSKFVLEDDVLYYQGKGKFQKVLFTAEKKRKAFEESHIISKDRHHGIRATGVNITKSYYWPRITLDARQWVKECKKCQKDRLAELEAQKALFRTKQPKRKWGQEPWEAQPLAPQVTRKPSISPKMKLPPPGLGKPKKTSMAKTPQARGLFHLIGLQLVGPMQLTPRGARFIFLVVDHFTRWVEAAPMKTCTPKETAEQVLKLVHRFGFPERIICTRSGEFVRQLNQILRKETNLQCDLVAAYLPQAHGLLEETNAFVKRLLTMVVERSTENWDLQLPNILFLQKQVEDEAEEEDLSSEDESEEDWDSDESLPQAPFPTASLELPPEESERITATLLSLEDICPYCNQLPDKGNSDLFTMLQCLGCGVWAHQTCVKQWQRNEDCKTRFQCKTCFPGQ